MRALVRANFDSKRTADLALCLITVTHFLQLRPPCMAQLTIDVPTSCLLGDTIPVTVKLTNPAQIDAKGITITVRVVAVAVWHRVQHLWEGECRYHWLG